MNISLLKSISLLSCGTIGTLIGNSSYEKIEEVQRNFYNFAKKLPQNLTWQKAWKLYSKE